MLGSSLILLYSAAATGVLCSMEPPSLPPLNLHIRTKRCSCNNWMDKECVYFCHLDIIWVNTGGQTLPYGLGNTQQRRRRSAPRCQCRDATDGNCLKFCRSEARDFAANQSEGEKAVLPGKGFQKAKTSQGRLLRALRKAIAKNMQTADASSQHWFSMTRKKKR
ncbi:endothelin-2 [Bombina bombina]|uniref:endothelin-2 n=1 Tax=Bombina bombina TaxID=8345 RepID=UPI00235B2DAF|nr:endothelin-2 [Bombina bombina]